MLQLKRLIIYLFVLIILLISVNVLLAQTKGNKQEYIFMPLVEISEFTLKNCDWYKEAYPKYSFATFMGDSILISWYYLDDLLIVKKPEDFFLPIHINNEISLFFYVIGPIHNNNLNIDVTLYQNVDKKIVTDLLGLRARIYSLLMNRNFIPGKLQSYPCHEIMLVSTHNDTVNCLIKKNQQFEKAIFIRDYYGVCSFLEEMCKK